MFRGSYCRLQGLQARLNFTRWNHSLPVKRALQYKVDDKIGKFVVRQVEEVPELHLAAVRLTHENTGADLLHLARDDRNNLFSVAFATIPQDSSGVAHILEHLSLCGSQLYPCRDPFMKMHNRSLATFMNAMTGCDVTFYPFSTQNPKDYENLLRVYLDAVFFPRLLRLDFMQEGWRFEHNTVEDKSSPITIKGVVYNEMKGQFSNSSHVFIQSIINKLYPSGVYSHCSGGHPLHIPDLTWDQLKEFHRTHYHPSNSRFLIYGDFPLEPTLSLIDQLALSKFSRIESNCSIPHEPKWAEPRKAAITCATDPMAANPEKQTTVSLTFAMNDVTDIQESFLLSVLSHLLVSGPNSPFYKNLLESGVGADFAPFLGYDSDLKQGMFSVGLHGVGENDAEKVADIVHKTFDEVIRDGFPQERIEAALHTIELGLKHQTSNFGLALNYAIVGIWNHKGNPIESLQVNRQVSWFKEQLKNNPRFLQEKVEQYFKANTHVLTTVMSPHCEHESRVKADEQENIEKHLATLSEEERGAVYADGLELLKWQNKKSDESCLPRLLLSDVASKVVPTVLNRFKMGSVDIQTTEQPTNGVTYFRTILNASHLPPEMKRMLPLFCEVATKMGTSDKDYRVLSQEAELKTGGLCASVHLVDHPSIPGGYEQGVLFSSHCLEANTEAMFSLWKDIFLRLSMEDEERLSQLIQMCAAGLAQSLPDSGHRYAMMQAGSYLSPSGQIREEFFGISHIEQMKTLAEAPSHKFLLPQLKSLAEQLLSNNSMRCSINASSSGLAIAEKHLDRFLSAIPVDASLSCPTFVQDPDFFAKERKIHFVFPFTVNYCAKSYRAVPYMDTDYASLEIASKLLSHKFLLREVREQGGAYGAGATVTPGGAFSFYSYRDPNLKRTLDSFSSGVLWLLKGEFTELDLEEAKLSCFAQVDSPVAPGSKGSRAFLSGITDEMKQQHRERLLAATKEDVVAAAARNISDQSTSSSAVIGPENQFTETGIHWMVHRDRSCSSAPMHDDLQTSANGASEPKSARHFLRLRGLPWKATTQDVLKLFEDAGVQIRGGENGILIERKAGRPSGRAFIELSSEADRKNALERDWREDKIGGRYVEVFPADTNVVRHYLASNPPPRSKEPGAGTKVVCVRGLPYTCTEKQLEELFRGEEVTELVLIRNSKGDCLGSGFVRFAASEQALAAVSKTGSRLGERTVDVFPSSDRDMNLICKEELPHLSQLRPNIEQKKLLGSPPRRVRNFRFVRKEHVEEELKKPGHRIIVSGVPPSKDYHEVADYFWPAKPSNVILVIDKEQNRSGKVIVEFKSHDDALRALEKQGTLTKHMELKMELHSSPVPHNVARTVAE